MFVCYGVWSHYIKGQAQLVGQPKSTRKRTQIIRFTSESTRDLERKYIAMHTPMLDLSKAKGQGEEI
jgi:hypothetical protein